MSEKKDDKKEEKQKEEEKPTSKEPQPTSKKGEGSETYWSFIKILNDATNYLERKLFPMLRRQNVDDETIAFLAIKMAVGIEDVLTSQLALVKPSIESIHSLDEVQAAVEKIYKQYAQKEISATDALDMLFSIFNSISKKK